MMTLSKLTAEITPSRIGCRSDSTHTEYTEFSMGTKLYRSNSMKKIIRVFQCRKCGKYMRPPFTSCILGHVTCKFCRNVKVCNICGNSSDLVKNHTLRTIFNKIKFPCNNFNTGCKAVLHGSEIVKHEKSCKFRRDNGWYSKWVKNITIEIRVKIITLACY